MQNIRLLLICLSSGAIAGLAIGGIGGRIAMRLVADSVGKFPELTLATANVLFIGTLLGLTGGLLFLVIRKFVPGSTLVRIIALSACVFAMVSATFLFQTPDDELAIAPQLGRILFSILFAAYSISVPLLGNALERIIPSDERFAKILLIAAIVLLLPSLLGLVAMFVSVFGISMG